VDRNDVPARHRALVDRLAAEARPVRPLWRPAARLLLWLALVVVVLGLVARFHLRPDARSALASPLFAAQLVALAAAGVAAALLALRAAVPGDEPTRGQSALVSGVAALGVALLLGEPGRLGPLATFVAQGIPCVVLTATLALAPWLALLVAVRRGAPLTPAGAGVWVGAGALLSAGALMRLACPSDDRFHLLAWHVTPVAAGIALSTAAARLLLGRRRGAA
jgi:hypothetical protein